MSARSGAQARRFRRPSAIARAGIVRIAVIGGSGHVGGFLVPRLVRAGHEVINMTRGARNPYVDDTAWAEVEQIQVDRAAEDAAGTFGKRVAALEAEVVVDMICFTPDSAGALVEALRGHSGHLVHCGTIWRYGAASSSRCGRTTPRRHSASTAPRRPPSRSSWQLRPNPAAWLPRCSSPVTSAAPAGHRSGRWEISTRKSGTHSRWARRSPFQASAPSYAPRPRRRRGAGVPARGRAPRRGSWGVVQCGGAVGADTAASSRSRQAGSDRQPGPAR